MKKTCRSRLRNGSRPFYSNPAIIAWGVLALIGLLLVVAVTGIS